MVKKVATDEKRKAAPVQFWYGANQSLLSLELRRWFDEFRKRHPQAVFTRLTYVPAADSELARTLHQAASGGGLFADTRLVVLEGAARAEAKGAVATEVKRLISTPPLGLVLLLVEGPKVAYSKGLGPVLKEATEAGTLNVREFTELGPAEVERWVVARATAEGGTIVPAVARLLVAAVGNDFLQLEQEVQKLLAYRGVESVLAADLDLLVHGNLPDDVFALVEAIGRRDFSAAAGVIEQQFTLGASPQALVGLLAWQLRVLTAVRLELDSGNDRTPVRELATTLGLHPFVVARALQQIPYYSAERLTWLYGELSALDVSLKRSRVSPQVLFTVFLGKLASLRVPSRT